MQVKILNSFLSFLNSLKRYGLILDKKDKKKTFFMSLLILIGTFLEMLSVGIIFPIIQIVLDDNFINNHVALSEIKNFFNHELYLTAYFCNVC